MAGCWRSASGAPHSTPGIDILFPVLHGLHGEDGAVQVLAEVGTCARWPLLSPVPDFRRRRQGCRQCLLKAPAALSVTINEGATPSLAVLEHELGLPLLSSRRARARRSASQGQCQPRYRAIAEAFRHDRRCWREDSFVAARLNTACWRTPQANSSVSRPGEIVPAESHGFYHNYNAKYIDENGAALMVPAELPPEVEAGMRDMAAKAFRAVGCDGMARVDFFLMPDMTFVVNELNTIFRLHRHQHVRKGDGGKRRQLCGSHRQVVAHGLARAGRSG